MGKVYEGKLFGEGLCFGVVVSRFNDFITKRLLEGAQDALQRRLGGLRSLLALQLSELQLHNLEPSSACYHWGKEGERGYIPFETTITIYETLLFHIVMRGWRLASVNACLRGLRW